MRSLKKDKIKLFLQEIDFNTKIIDYSIFSDYRINKINNAKTDNKRALNIQTEILLNYAINYKSNNYTPYPSIIINEQGKPSFENLKTKFNISHSNKYILIGVSNNEIGVDVEKINEKHLKVASKLFNDKDYLKYKNNINEIIRHWTIKEAYIKLFGSNILIDLKNIKVTNKYVFGQYGKAYYTTIVENDHFITIASKNKHKIKLYRDKDYNI